MSSNENPIGFPDEHRSELDRAIEELVEKARNVLATQGRLRNLLAATRAIAEDLDLSTVLRRIAQAAVDLVGAQYGALGVIAPDGSLEQFIHVGLPPEKAESIGHLPRGRGILGALITDPRPVRLEHLAADPRSSGFPAHHPDMDNFVGVPIAVRGEAFGNLYLTNRADGPFSSEDEELLMSLAAAAGVAIYNARLYGETQRRQRWALASAEVSSALLNEEGADPLRLIAESMLALTDAATVVLVTPTGDALVMESAWGEDAARFEGRVFPVGESLSGRVIDSGNPAVSFGVPFEGAADTASLTGPAMAVPLPRAEGVRGALVVFRPEGAARFQESDLEMASDFAAHAGVTLELRAARRVRERLALLEDRSRIARDLHDNVIQRLFGAGLALNGIDYAGVPPGSSEKLDLISGLLDEAIAEIRKSVFALRSVAPVGVDARHRLLNAVSGFADAFLIAPRVSFEGSLDDRAPDDLVEDLESVIREGLANAVRHAEATTVAVLVHVDRNLVSVRIEDDGRGPGGRTRTSGLGNLEARAAGRGGGCSLTDGETGGSVLEWWVPLADGDGSDA
jgi:signal transduction histidine kinase